MNGKQGLELRAQTLVRRHRWFLIAIAVLLLTNIGSVTWAIRSTGAGAGAKTHNNPYPLIDPAREFIGQKDAVTNLQPLREFLRKLVKDNQDVDIGVYFEFLNTGSNISINPDTRFYAASLVKLPIAMVAMKKMEKGEWRMDNELVLLPEDLNSDSGKLYAGNPIGTRFTIETLIKASLKDSDNMAHRILIRNLSQDDNNGLIDAIGLYDLFDNDQQITAKEYSRILRALYTASYLRREASQQVLQWLAEAEFQGYLSQGIEPGITFAHKYGEHLERFIYSDSGIVYVPNRTYILTVMIKGKLNDPEANQEKAEALMDQISKQVFDYVKKI